MEQKIDEFLIYMKNVKKISDNTMLSYKRDLYQVIKFFKTNGISDLAKVTSTSINSYILHLEKSGKSPATIARNVSSINMFFKFLIVNRVVNGDPTELIKAPKVEKKAPKEINGDEIERLLMQPGGKGNKAVRDKAMLELLYSTGVRISEIINLKISDVNLQLGYVVCKNDKNDRVLPFGNKVKVSLSKYIYEVRNNEEDIRDEWLFLNCFGKQMSRQGIWKIIKTYADKAEIKSDITPHILSKAGMNVN